MMRALAVVLLVGACGCEKASDGTAAKPKPAPSVTIRLDDPGRGPRNEVRLNPAVGKSKTYLYVHRVQLPGVPDQVHEMTYNTCVVDLDDDQIHNRLTMLAAIISPPSNTGDDQTILGSTVDGWRDRRGFYTRPLLQRTRFEGEGDSRPELAFALPKEAIGSGARWHEDVDLDGARANVEVELESVEGPRLLVRLSYRTAKTIRQIPVTITGSARFGMSTVGGDGELHVDNSITFHARARDYTGRETIDVRPIYVEP
jgi:hypothetical protein